MQQAQSKFKVAIRLKDEEQTWVLTLAAKTLVEPLLAEPRAVIEDKCTFVVVWSQLEVVTRSVQGCPYCRPAALVSEAGAERSRLQCGSYDHACMRFSSPQGIDGCNKDNLCQISLQRAKIL